MKIRYILAGFAASLMFAMPTMAEETALSKNMETINDAYKAMRRETDSSKGAALAREAQEAIANSISETPEMVAKMADGKEKTKAAAEYRRAMGSLLGTFANMEIAFLDGDLDQVKAIVTEIREGKKKGHDKFMEDE